MKHSHWLGLCLLALTACGQPPPPPPEPSLIVDSRVVFLAADARTPRAAPGGALRIWAPHLVGDLYGSPNEGEIVRVSLQPDLTFRLDLNGAAKALEKALLPTRFSQRWMTVEPAEARIARLIPFVLEADGIAPVGTTEWLDADSGRRLMLVYVDRPARIRGDIVHEGRQLHFDIAALAAGYLWVEQPDGDGTFRAIPRPPKLVLAVLP